MWAPGSTPPASNSEVGRRASGNSARATSTRARYGSRTCRTQTRDGSAPANRGVVKQMPAAVVAASSTYFGLSRNERSSGPARSSGAIPLMRRSRSAPSRASPLTRDAISRSESPPLRLKKKGALMPPCPWRWRATRSECRPAAKPEELLPIVLLFQERYREVEADRSEWRRPQDTGADRRTHVHGVVERAIRIRRRTERPLDSFPSCREVE